MKLTARAVVFFLATSLALTAASCKRAPSPSTLMAEADKVFDQGRYNDAYSMYRQVVERDPKNVHALIRLAECCLWLQDAERGLEWINKALDVDPHSAVAWEKKGELLLARGDAAKAAQCFKKALSYDGNLNVARLNLSIAYEAMGKIEKAIEVAREAVALQPRAAEPHVKLAMALQAAKKYDEAEAELRRAIALDPKHVIARVTLARMLIGRKKDLQQARKLAQEADRLDPGNGEAAVLAAWALYLSGEKKSALRELEQVARAHPTNFEAWALLARGLRELGHDDAARKAAAIALRLAPRVALFPTPSKSAGH